MKGKSIVLEEQDDYFRVEFYHRERGVVGFLYLAKDRYDESEAVEVGELLVGTHDAWWQHREYLQYHGGTGKIIVQ